MIANKVRSQKIELLAPAGDPSAFRAAVENGADAVYLGLNQFNARRRAANFKPEELEAAVQYAHLRDVQIYLAFNVLLKDSEIPAAVQLLERGVEAGCDAVIIQDWAVHSILSKAAAGLRLHASTQMNAHNLKAVEMLRDHGFARVTLSREASLSEIKTIAGIPDIEIEVFGHGALCFSYSGLCLFSAMVSGRSGNRGLCPQACRLPYTLMPGSAPAGRDKAPGPYLLNMRDLCAINRLPELHQAGIKALKIEGRNKSADYVAAVTRVYRKALDRYYENPGSYKVGDDDLLTLKEAFNRGFTDAYLDGKRGAAALNPKQPNHRGVFIGRVTFCDALKGRLGLKLRHSLSIGDKIEVWIKRGGRLGYKVKRMEIGGNEVASAPAGETVIIEVENRRHLIKQGDRVFRVHNQALFRAARDSFRGAKPGPVPLHLEVTVQPGEPARLVGEVIPWKVKKEVTLEAPAESGIKRSLSQDDIKRQLGKFGGTPYHPAGWTINIKGEPMVGAACLNQMRRKLVDELNDWRLSNHPKVSWKTGPATGAPKKTAMKNRKPELIAQVATTAQRNAAIESGADWLYVQAEPPRRFSNDFHIAQNIVKARPAGLRIAVVTPGIAKQADLEKFQAAIDASRRHIDAVVVSNLGFGHLDSDPPISLIGDYKLNIWNPITADRFADLNFKRLTLSPELSLEDIRNVASVSELPIEILSHGWLEVMTAESCFLSAFSRACEQCGNESFAIKDRQGFVFPVETSTDCCLRVYNSKQLCLLKHIPSLTEAGVSHFRLLLERYSPNEIRTIVSAYRLAIDSLADGADAFRSITKRKLSHPSFQDHTTGHIFRPSL